MLFWEIKQITITRNLKVNEDFSQTSCADKLKKNKTKKIEHWYFIQKEDSNNEIN